MRSSLAKLEIKCELASKASAKTLYKVKKFYKMNKNQNGISIRTWIKVIGKRSSCIRLHLTQRH